MKKITHKGKEIKFSDYDIEEGWVYIKFGAYTYVMTEEDFSNLEITEE